MKQDSRSKPLFIRRPTSRFPEDFNAGLDSPSRGAGSRMLAVSKQAIQIDIWHDSSPYRKRLYHTLLPTENPEAPFLKGDERGIFGACRQTKFLS